VSDPNCLAKNVGAVDRVVRLMIILGLWIWPLAVPMSTVMTEVMALIGGALLVTVVTAHCMVYSMMNISTRRLARTS